MCLYLFCLTLYEPLQSEVFISGDLSLPLFRSLSLSLLEDSITSFSSGCWHFHIYPAYLLAFFYSFCFNIYLFIWLCQVLVAACGILFPDQGLNLGPLHWEHGVLATGPPRKPTFIVLNALFFAVL